MYTYTHLRPTTITTTIELEENLELAESARFASSIVVICHVITSLFIFYEYMTVFSLYHFYDEYCINTWSWPSRRDSRANFNNDSDNSSHSSSSNNTTNDDNETNTTTTTTTKHIHNNDNTWSWPSWRNPRANFSSLINMYCI